MDTFDRAFDEVIDVEGRYSNNAADRGGKTNWGITERLARAYDYGGDMQELPKETARTIYRKEFWDSQKLRLSDMAEVSEDVAVEVFEQAVNTGVTLTARRVQRVLNINNRDEHPDYYPDLKVDGWLGRTTREAVEKLVNLGRERYLLQWLNVAQGRHYFDLCESDPTQEEFAAGWIDKRVKVG